MDFCHRSVSDLLGLPLWLTAIKGKTTVATVAVPERA